MGLWLRRIGVSIVLAGIALGGVCAYVRSAFVAPSNLAIDRVVVIPKGVGTETIAKILADDDLIKDPTVFMLGLRLERLMDGRGGFLRAGEFRVPARASPKQVAEILRGGKTVVRKITVAEGLTTAEILDLLTSTDGLTGSVPPDVGEGSLLPETYHFGYGDSRSALVRRMRDDFIALLGDLWPRRARDIPIQTTREAVILASIIEKETGVADERARIAGVFVNRLRRGMRLQSDPTVVYGLTEGVGPLGRPLTRDDLRRPTAFNTYTIKGLPPTPIANPGRAAIEAALNPLRTGELYFVADGKGGHKFAKTLEEHNRNVRDYRRGLE